MSESSSFLIRLEQGLEDCGLRGQTVLLGVSGGPDSVAMLRGLCGMAEQRQLCLRAAHLNHHLRGARSDDDARWLADLCRQLGVELTVGSSPVRSLAEEQRIGIEQCAREQRYAFLEETALGSGCTHVAVAHTADDQAETILHHLLRGTGLAGLRGMPQTRPLGERLLLVRPLLKIGRSQVEAYLSELGQEAREDESNRDLAFTRNRIRESLLPRIERDYNPNIREALLRLGRQASDVQDALEAVTSRILREAVTDACETVCRVDCGRLSAEPRHLIRECFIQLWKELSWPRQHMGFAEWDKLADLVHTDGAATLPAQVQATRRGRLLVLRHDRAAK